MILFDKPDGTTKFGRRGCRWFDSIKMGLQEIVQEDVDSIHLLWDRVRCWHLVKSSTLGFYTRQGLFFPPPLLLLLLPRQVSGHWLPKFLVSLCDSSIVLTVYLASTWAHAPSDPVSVLYFWARLHRREKRRLALLSQHVSARLPLNGYLRNFMLGNFGQFTRRPK